MSPHALPIGLPTGLLLLGLLGCQASPDSEPRDPAPLTRIELVDRPQSALTALVRILEALDALQAPDVEVRLRAVECDTLPSGRQKPPHVRVVLALTFYAYDHARAEEAQEELLAGLQEEGLASSRMQRLAGYRIQRVFEEMAWNAPRVHTERDFDALVSLSSSIQVEVYDASDSDSESTLPGGVAQAAQGTAPTSGVEEYIRSIAASPELDMGALRVDLSPYRLRDERVDLRYRIQPLRQGDSFRRGQIGSFLYELESQSPGVRITHLEIAPSDPGEDLRRDLWSFETDLTLRLSEGQGAP